MSPKGYKVLRAVHPNIGIRVEYRKRLDAIIASMNASYTHWLTAAYRRNEPEMAMDAAEPQRVTAVQAKGATPGGYDWTVYVDGTILKGSNWTPRTFKSQAAAENAGLKAGSWNAVLTKPVLFADRFDLATLGRLPVVVTPAKNLQEALDGLGAQWAGRLDEMGPKLARWFATRVESRTAAGLQKVLRDGGMSVKFTMTPTMRDVFDATVGENVGLIRSIGSQYHTEVQGMVMRSVAVGRDLASLTNDLQARYGITRRRAAFIALDQNQKATSSFTRVRQTEAGITQAIWMHSSAGKVPRRTHLANNGKIYNIAEGWLDPDPKVNKRIWPGELINCRCTSRPVVKGFS
jgi:SPP1 gp7 family putative phage head morphogenesis protein